MPDSLPKHQSLDGAGAVLERRETDVFPVFSRRAGKPSLAAAGLADTLDQLPQAVEIIFADDGSRDGSAAALDAFAVGDPRVRVRHLSRNYDQTAALMSAIQNSTGDVIILMDADAQNDPLMIRPLPVASTSPSQSASFTTSKIRSALCSGWRAPSNWEARC